MKAEIRPKDNKDNKKRFPSENEDYCGNCERYVYNPKGLTKCPNCKRDF